MFGGASTSVQLNSSPPGINIALKGNPIGITPCTYSIENSYDRDISFQLQGYETKIMKLNKSFKWTSLWNVFNSGFEWIVGFTTGAVRKMDNRTLHVKLSPKARN